MLKEFKAFIMRGNVVDLAVAVIIGAAFSAIIGSLVADIITPLILKPALEAAQVDKLEELSWNGVLYGKFLSTVLNFIIVAFCIFMVIKAISAHIVRASFNTLSLEHYTSALLSKALVFQIH
jgi:large conductance mechanosensitive channel